MEDMSATQVEQVELAEFSLSNFVNELIDELKVYQNYKGRVTSVDQVICFNNVAQVSFRISPDKLPTPVRKLYEDAKSGAAEDCSFEILVRVLERLVIG